nr:MAG TPA: 4Fe-4S binding domain protein [Caudoviricetes sp.]
MCSARSVVLVYHSVGLMSSRCSRCALCTSWYGRMT